MARDFTKERLTADGPFLLMGAVDVAGVLDLRDLLPGEGGDVLDMRERARRQFAAALVERWNAVPDALAALEQPFDRPRTEAERNAAAILRRAIYGEG